jgi:thiamine-phosphate pyrophosphorylase
VNRPVTATLPPSPRLFLITPGVADAVVLTQQLEAAMAVGVVDCVYLRLAISDEAGCKRLVQALAPIVQGAGAVLLIEPPVEMRNVARWGADGVHVAQPEHLNTALTELKPPSAKGADSKSNWVVGAGGLRSKDAAMAAGEDGCDYVMFGEPRADGSLPPIEQVVERCQWWAEVFNTPCVGYAPSQEAVKALAPTGIEFVALGAWAFIGSAAQVGQVVAEAAKLLEPSHSAV